MKKISILSSFPPIKWITPYTIEFIKALDKKSEVTFLGFKDIYPEFLYPNGTKDTSLKTPKLKNTHIYNTITWYNPFSWISAGMKIDWDILHAQWWSWPLFYIYLTIGIIAKLRKKHIILTVHNVIPHEKSLIKNFCNNIVYKIADKFIVHSQENKKTLESIVWKKKSIMVIPHGILKPKEEIIWNREEFRKKYKISEDKKVLLFFWNIRDYKWLDILLGSFSELLKKDDSYFLIIAGPCWKEWGKYQKIINDKKLSHSILRIDWFVWEMQTWELFILSNLLVLPYRNFDSQSWVIATNLYYHLPIIVSNLWGLTEVISDTNLIFEVWDSSGLTAKIQYLFENNLLPAKKQSLSSLKENYEWGNIVEKTLEFYEK